MPALKPWPNVRCLTAAVPQVVMEEHRVGELGAHHLGRSAPRKAKEAHRRDENELAESPQSAEATAGPGGLGHRRAGHRRDESVHSSSLIPC